jgi:hypothetical protein
MAPSKVRSDSKVMTLALRPNAESIAAITTDGDIAVVVFEATDAAVDLARLLGWNGAAPVFRLNDGIRRAFAGTADIVTARWLTRDATTPRVFLLTRRGSLLLNGDERGDWWTEPGSSDPLVVV